MPCEISLPVDVDSLSRSLLGTFSFWGVYLHCSQKEIMKDLIKPFAEIQMLHAHFISLIELASGWMTLATINFTKLVFSKPVPNGHDFSFQVSHL